MPFSLELNLRLLVRPGGHVVPKGTPTKLTIERQHWDKPYNRPAGTAQVSPALQRWVSWVSWQDFLGTRRDDRDLEL